MSEVIKIGLSGKDLDHIRVCAKTKGLSVEEFVHQAVMQKIEQDYDLQIDESYEARVHNESQEAILDALKIVLGINED